MNRLAALAALAALACHSSSPRSAAPALVRGLAAALSAADHARAPWRCAALDLPALTDEPVAIGAQHWQLAGHALRRLDDPSALTIGVVADAGGAAPTTLAALGRLRAKLDEAHADVVVALGGMGATAAELQATLGALADRAAFPVVALPGDLEPTTAHATAIAALRARGAPVIDGRLVRWIELPGATIATVPGAGAAERLAAGDEGCAWRREDVAAVFGELGKRAGLRVAAIAEPPRELVAGEPVGELALVPPTAAADVVLHGPAAPAPTPARAGSRDGSAATLSPGTADATTRLPDAHSPAAGILAIRGGAWSWKPIVDAPGR